MAEVPYIVIDRSTNQAKNRARQSSDSDSSMPSVSPSSSRETSPARPTSEGLKLRDKISSVGGFTSILSSGGACSLAQPGEVFVFPSKVLKKKEREAYLREFTARLYKIEDNSVDVNKILRKVAPPCRTQTISPKL